MEDWMTIRNLKKKNPYMGTRKIADLVGVSRSTVKKVLASEMYPSYHREPTIPVLIDPFAEYIKESYLVRKQKVVLSLKICGQRVLPAPLSVYTSILCSILKPKETWVLKNTMNPTLPFRENRCSMTGLNIQ